MKWLRKGLTAAVVAGLMVLMALAHAPVAFAVAVVAACGWCFLLERF